jgi:hypothetical protein
MNRTGFFYPFSAFKYMNPASNSKIKKTINLKFLDKSPKFAIQKPLQ